MSDRKATGPEAGDEFEQMIADGTMEFHASTPEALEPWGRLLARQFLGTHRIGWKLGSRKVGTAYVLKLDDPKLCYLDIYPDTEQFMWCGEGHHDSIHPDEALAYLMAKDFGVDIKMTDIAPGVQAIRVERKKRDG